MIELIYVFFIFSPIIGNESYTDCTEKGGIYVEYRELENEDLIEFNYCVNPEKIYMNENVRREKTFGRYLKL